MSDPMNQIPPHPPVVPESSDVFEGFDDLSVPPTMTRRGRLKRRDTAGGPKPPKGAKTARGAKPLVLPKNLSLKGLGKRQPTVSVDQTRPVPTTTAFDLLEGGFATARNTRRVNIALVILFSVATLYMAGTGVVYYVARGQAASNIQLDQNSVNILSKKIASTIAGGQSPEIILSHHTARMSAAQAVQSQAVDIAKVLAGLRAAAPGAQITSISLTMPPPPALVVPGASTTTTTLAPGVPATATGVVVSVSYELSGTSQIIVVQNAINQLPFITAGSTQFSGAIGANPTQVTGSVSVTFTAVLNAKANVNRTKGL